MGFYAPAQLVRDARAHGVEVRPVEAGHSDWESTLEDGEDGPAVRLGLALVHGLSREGARRLVEARAAGSFESVQTLASRARLDRDDLTALSAAGALAGLAGHRHRAAWRVTGVEKPLPLLPEPRIAEGLPLLRAPQEGEDIVADYRALGLTLGRHPLALLRERLRDLGWMTAGELWDQPDGTAVRCGGIVVTRQRPGSASGVTFVTVEDETGSANLIVWRSLGDRQRRVLLGARLLEVRGSVQREGDVLHVVARRLEDRSMLLGALEARSRDFR